MKKIVTIVGPTASGKSSLGISLAKRFDGEVISVDSRQVYRGMDIGTGKVRGMWQEQDIEVGGSIGQMFGERHRLMVDGVPHWGIDLVDPDEGYNGAEYKVYAEKCIEAIFARGALPILVGGTGMWLKAVIDNLDLAGVPGDPVLRAELERCRLGDLLHEYKQLDPAGAEMIDKHNKRRVVRALEVTKLTGTPFSERTSQGEPRYDALQIGLRWERQDLYARIEARVDEMIAEGLVDEVRTLRDRYGCEGEAMTGIGYRQVCDFLSGETDLATAIAHIKRDTRRYAKRQMTWLKRDERIRWVEPGDVDEVERLIESFI